MDVALDLSCVSDLDARGLGVLATLVRRARQRGTTVSLIAASHVVQRLGEMAGLNGTLHGGWNERTGLFGCGARTRPSSGHSAGRNSLVGVCGAAA